jgi:hypothetical protein
MRGTFNGFGIVDLGRKKIAYINVCDYINPPS